MTEDYAALCEQICSIYDMPDIRALDKRALEMFERDAFSNLSPLRILLRERKGILNDRFIYNDETRKLLQQFSHNLNDALLRAYRQCYKIYRTMQATHQNLTVTGCLMFSDDFAWFHPYKSELYQRKDNDNMWDVLTDQDVESLWPSFEHPNPSFFDFRINSNHYDELEFLGLTDANDDWTETTPQVRGRWAEGLGLTMHSHQLIDDSLMSLYDLMFIRDYVIGYNIVFTEGYDSEDKVK